MRAGHLIAACALVASTAWAQVPVPTPKPPPPSAPKVAEPAAPKAVLPEPAAVPPVDAVAACRASLAAAGITFKPVDDASDGACKLEGAVAVESIASRFGSVALDGAPVMLCSFAGPLSAWIRDVAAPVATAQFGSPLQRIEIGTGFACRNRYGKADAKISEHAKGNAIDISALVLASKRRIEVGSTTQDDAAAFMRGIRTGACGYFTTVLGPGSNAAHAEHLHLDLGLHGRSTSYRICE